jgi:hypothetical protein
MHSHINFLRRELGGARNHADFDGCEQEVERDGSSGKLSGDRHDRRRFELCCTSGGEAGRVCAELDVDLRGRSGRCYFVPALLHCDAEGFVAKPLANQCSALVRTAADATAIATVPEMTSGSSAGFRRGDLIEVEVFDWPSKFRSASETHLAKEVAG